VAGVTLDIKIDELVLHGVVPEDAQTVADAIRSQLTARAAGWLAEGGGAPSPRIEASRRLPAMDIADSRPVALGEAVAGAVWNALLGGRT
jgi:hypothetical protein